MRLGQPGRRARPGAHLRVRRHSEPAPAGRSGTPAPDPACRRAVLAAAPGLPSRRTPNGAARGPNPRAGTRSRPSPARTTAVGRPSPQPARRPRPLTLKGCGPPRHASQATPVRRPTHLQNRETPALRQLTPQCGNLHRADLPGRRAHCKVNRTDQRFRVGAGSVCGTPTRALRSSRGRPALFSLLPRQPSRCARKLSARTAIAQRRYHAPQPPGMLRGQPGRWPRLTRLLTFRSIGY